MMDWTDRHCRYFHRILSPNALLYTEMVTTGALIHGDVDRHLQFNKAEHPVALQLGGSDPKALAECAKIGMRYGYDEINLNVGCPSDRVQSGAFGACLMTKADLVADCMAEMKNAVAIPTTVKTRLGVDEHDSYAFARDFVGTVSNKGGVDIFIIHARKAWLKGLSPKENREVPPLQWERVYQLKKDFPHLTFVINGGIQTVEHWHEMHNHIDGVMLGRAAYQNPSILLEMERTIFKTIDLPSKQEVIERMISYIKAEEKKGTPIPSITRHMLGLFRDQKGARQWRRHLSENTSNMTVASIRQAIEFLA